MVHAVIKGGSVTGKQISGRFSQGHFLAKAILGKVPFD